MPWSTATLTGSRPAWLIGLPPCSPSPENHETLMNKISFGVRVPNSGPLSSVENIVSAAKAAEEMGFDALWVHDHVVWSAEMHRHHISSGAKEALEDHQDANFFEATTILSYLAAETQKIVLGVACLVM